MLGQRPYGHLEEEAEGDVASDPEIALRFEGDEASVNGVVPPHCSTEALSDPSEMSLRDMPEVSHHTSHSAVELAPSVLGRAQIEEEKNVQNGPRHAAACSLVEGAPVPNLGGVRFRRTDPVPARAHLDDGANGDVVKSRMSNVRDAELVRLQSENMELQREVERLKEVASENRELQQVVKQLRGVVASYGFSEVEIMNAKPKKGQEGAEQLRYAPRELFMIISMKFAEIAAYYSAAYIYTNFFTEELGMSDQVAGNIYAAYGFISTFLGVGAGIVIDKLGVRKSLLIGTISSVIARFGTGVTNSKVLAVLISITLFPLGGAFGVPVLALGIRRYSHKDNRKFAFSIFYTMLMLATLLGTMSINQIRGFFPIGTSVFGWELSWMRLVWMFSTALSLYTVLCAFFLREIYVLDDKPLEDMVIEPAKPATGSSMAVLKQIAKNPRFWRLTMVSVIFCGVQMGFRHLDATFPKYMMRTYGENAPWEVILSINPIVVFFCAPVCTALLIKYNVGFRKALLLGAFLSGFSPFFLAAFESYLGSIVWITIMSIGQAIWGPKLYEYSTMSAPQGREGLYVAITASPIYLSTVPTGLVSGWLLEHYCPKNSRPEDRQGQLLWFWVAVSVCTSPILLWLFRKKLLKRGEDKPPEQVQDQRLRVGSSEVDLDEEQLLEVPSATHEGNVVWGNAGVAWAGMGTDMGGSLSEDSDADFEDDPSEARGATRSPTLSPQANIA